MPYTFFKSFASVFILCISGNLIAAESQQTAPTEVYFAQPIEAIIVQESLRGKSHWPWVKWLMQRYLLRLERQLKNKEIVPIDLVGHRSGVRAVAITPDKSKIVTGSYDCHARIWNGRTGECLITLPAHSTVDSVAMTPDGSHVVTGMRDGTAIVWDALKGTAIAHFKLLSVAHVAITNDGLKIVTGSIDGNARVWDVNTGECLLTLPHTKCILDLAITSDNSKIRTVTYCETLEDLNADIDDYINPKGVFTLQNWDLETGKLLETETKEAEYTGDKVAALTSYEKDFVYADLRKPGSRSINIETIAMTPGGLKCVAGYQNGGIRICTAESKHDLLMLGKHKDGILSVAISSDGTTVVTGGLDNIAKIWNIGDVHAELMKLTTFKQLTFLKKVCELANKSDFCRHYKLDLVKETKTKPSDQRLTQELKDIHNTLPQLIKDLIADYVKVA